MTLLKEDGMFGSFVNTCHLEQVVGVMVYFVTIDSGLGLGLGLVLGLVIGHLCHVFHPLFSARPLLGTCFLTTYSHKRIPLLTEFMVF